MSGKMKDDSAPEKSGTLSCCVTSNFGEILMWNLDTSIQCSPEMLKSKDSKDSLTIEPKDHC